MPAYIKDINIILTREDAQAMIDRAQINRDKFLVAVLYLTGARPAELRELKKEDITINEEYIIVKLVTKKLEGNTKGFQINERVLEIPMSAPFSEILLGYLPLAPNARPLVDINESRMRQIIYALSDNRFCPYHFRHSRMVKLMRAGASASELMYWKGARSLKSVEPYIRGKPIGRKLIID